MGSRYLFVTGKLAEPALRRLLGELAGRLGFEYEVAVLPITVAALANVPWIVRHLAIPAGVQRVVLPGLCVGDPLILTQATGIAAEHGPSDLRELPDFLGTTGVRPDLTQYDIEIVAEINHVARLGREDLLARARHYRASGADVIDLGCDAPGGWAGIGDAVKLLRDEGLRVSIDSFDPREVGDAVRAGAELVLSVNSRNCEQAPDWGVEVVALPDEPEHLVGLVDTIDFLVEKQVSFRVDPVLEPIGLGFAKSLGRYLDVRRRYPEVPMLMGVGNLTELTDVDSAGINVLLLAFCQELGIRSVLTTEVINWCRSSVRELDLARRLVHFAQRERIPPKKVMPDLIALRDPKLRVHGDETLRELAARITDHNFRIFAERGELHVCNRDGYWHGTDPFALFKALHNLACGLAPGGEREIDPAHAFYLGYEMAKAVTALTLGKNYVQDQPLRWGHLTKPEGPAHG